jgi:MSHA biogenesis protein MshQ
MGQNATVTDFPILVALPPERIDYNVTRPGGIDIRFTDVQGNVIPHEIEQWTPNDNSFVWVRVPVINQMGSNKTGIWMYYGNPSAPDVQDAKSVWSKGYRGVWHLQEKGEALKDSSGTNGAATNHGSTVIADGKIGPARNFQRAFSHWIDTGFSEDLSQFTIEVWVKATSAPSTALGPNGPLMREKNFQICWDHNEPYTGGASLRSNGNWPNADFAPLKADTWIYLVATHDGAGLRSFTNGVLSNQVAAGASDSEAETAKIGRHAFGTTMAHHFDGDIDEVRISNIVHGGIWISAQYRSMNDTLLTYFAEEKGSFTVP